MRRAVAPAGRRIAANGGSNEQGPIGYGRFQTS